MLKAFSRITNYILFAFLLIPRQNIKYISIETKTDSINPNIKI